MWPLFAYFALVLVLVTATLVVSYLLGPRHSEPATGDPYEGGIVSVAARELGWAGYCEVVLFVGVLFASLIYLWKIGALDWARKPRRARASNG